MEKTELLFSKESKYDSKNIVNKSNVKLDESILSKIDNGVTIETLDELIQEHGLKVFKYKTQITIHGLFPETVGFIVGGYSSIFQNKNKSIGVRWIAVDNEKRDELQKKLGFLGFSRAKDSQRDFFTIQRIVNETNLQEVKKELLEKYNRIDETLFYGSKDLYLARCPYGRQYLCLDLYINAIYQKNVQELLDKLGYNEKEHNERIEREREESEKKRTEWRERQEQKEKEKENILKNDSDFKFLRENHERVKTMDTGRYYSFGLNYDNEKVFYAISIEKEGKKRFNRMYKKEFSTLAELKNFDWSFGWETPSMVKYPKTLLAV